MDGTDAETPLLAVAFGSEAGRALGWRYRGAALQECGGLMKKAVSLINAIDIGRFPRLLTRILQKLHLKAENSFSEEEEEKLQAAFSLEKQDLHLVLETISFILEQLETVGWQLNLQMAHSAQAKLKSPQAVLQLGVSGEDSKSMEKVLVEFSHQELFDFYNKLETIQAQLDSLT
ncbi:COMM domain-containing protein 10 isoform X3 [Prionailurus viverrinus]|uniref:COMM domain-containing protein 10 isoform X3 n=1 Tax=Prionailurus viverrinus TaxID=61388 RepID=UPI001FF2D16F|nr:COMM domain-containing protein 10 isoform X3 [Prionailurus viverrinus]